jgi:hypothetical protein
MARRRAGFVTRSQPSSGASTLRDSLQAKEPRSRLCCPPHRRPLPENSHAPGWRNTPAARRFRSRPRGARGGLWDSVCCLERAAPEAEARSTVAAGATQQKSRRARGRSLLVDQTGTLGRSGDVGSLDDLRWRAGRRCASRRSSRSRTRAGWVTSSGMPPGLGLGDVGGRGSPPSPPSFASESAGGGEENKWLSSAGTNSAAANRISVNNRGRGS